ncbi:MAG: YjgP/YjgQ family permease [Candidatus Dadabacteria bacterium]|nr:MAG: YjgP/YjgQ family permease [Candidatus Dadabacteria bacterium]
MKRLTLYILREAAGPLVLLLIIGTALLIVNRLLKVLPLLLEFHVDLLRVLGVLGWLVPSLLLYALPIASWVGWLVGYGRLGSDGELSALASVGASPMQALRPALISGLALTIVALWLAESAYGPGRRQFQIELGALARESAVGALQPGTVAALSDELWVIVPPDPAGGGPVLIREPDLVLSLGSAKPATDGAALAFADASGFLRSATEPTWIGFEHGRVRLDLPMETPAAGAREMRLHELAGSTRLSWQVEFHQRLALVFSLLIAPLAAFVVAPRRTRSGGRGVAMLVALLGFVAYYGLFTAGKQAALKGWLPAWAGMWSGNLALLLVAGGALLRRLRRPGLP